jgi:hypothetical protein
MPTRGQALYIALISVLNAVFLVAPYTALFPQNTFSSIQDMEISTMANRAGVLAMGNMVAMFVFSARNNILLWLADWPYDTFILMHRWLGYWSIFLTALHSVMFLVYYLMAGTYEEEAAKAYWIWGVVGTVCGVALWPCSLLVVRRKGVRGLPVHASVSGGVLHRRVLLPYLGAVRVQLGVRDMGVCGHCALGPGALGQAFARRTRGDEDGDGFHG